jgi:AraC-like DNA-binding protein
VTGSVEDFSSIRLTTDFEIPQRRVELAREVFGRQMLRLDVEPHSEQSFRTDLKLRALPGLKLVTGLASDVTTDRTTSLLADGNDDIFFSIGETEGKLIAEQRGRQIVVEHGGVSAISNAERFSLTHLGSRTAGLMVPYKALATLVPDLDDRIAHPLPRYSDGLRLLRGYIGTLTTSSTFHRPDTAVIATTHIHDLLCLIIGASRDGEEVIATRGLKAAQLLAIKSFVNKNLSDRTLSINTVTATQRLGRRYVQRLFEEEGTTFSNYVANQRLKRAKRFLEDGQQAHRTISAIAYDCGFSDIAHFNRTFRRSFELAPSDIRRVLAAVRPNEAHRDELRIMPAQQGASPPGAAED